MEEPEEQDDENTHGATLPTVTTGTDAMSLTYSQAKAEKTKVQDDTNSNSAFMPTVLTQTDVMSVTGSRSEIEEPNEQNSKNPNSSIRLTQTDVMSLIGSQPETEEQNDNFSNDSLLLTVSTQTDVMSVTGSQSEIEEPEEHGDNSSNGVTLPTVSTNTDNLNISTDFLSEEESNFLRFSHLLLKVAPQAVRHRFDQEFQPNDLERIIQGQMAVLTDLKRRRVITHQQWKIICSTAEFIQDLLKNKNDGKVLAQSFNFSFRYIDDVLSLNNKHFGDYVERIYPKELEIKDTTDSLEIDSEGHLKTKLYDKRDDFNFPIVNFRFICSNIPTAPGYGVYISRLIRYSIACDAYTCFSVRGRLLTSKLMNQGFLEIKLKSSLRSPHLSLNFDITLMTCLIRNMSNVLPSSGNYDTLPPSSDTSLGADLARMKYYRNNIAHSLEKDRKLKKTDFPIVWDDAAKAIGRLGGQQYQKECASLLITNLDSSYRDIMRELLNVLKREEDLKREMNKENEERKQEIERLELKQKDPIPQNIRENMKATINRWEYEDHMFVPTNASKAIEKIIETDNCVVITGCPGSGKSFTAQHVLLYMLQKGFDVMPVTLTSDITRYYDRNVCQVFFVDDFCGRFNISNFAIAEWQQNINILNTVFTNPHTKCMFTCRSQIFRDSRFKILNINDFKMVDFSGDHDHLTLKDKLLVAKSYLDPTIVDKINETDLSDTICFPLLCKVISSNSISFDDARKQVFQLELDGLKHTGDNLKYACIALCVIFNNKIPLDMFKTITNSKINQILTNVFEELEVNIATPKKTLLASMNSLVGTYLKTTKSTYEAMHNYMFDIFCAHVSATMIECVIECGDSKLISDRALLQSVDENYNSFIIIPTELEGVFFERIIKDITNCKIEDVFGSYQMKYKKYRIKFMNVFRRKNMNLHISYETGNSPLSMSSQLGYIDIVEMINRKGQSPYMHYI